MGACVSTQQKSNSAMKVHELFGSNDVNIVKHSINNGDLAANPQWSFRDYGCKEETFFDSQAWLESDCDDDFMSVNGEFTPSSGNTPVHHSLRGNYEFLDERDGELVQNGVSLKAESPLVHVGEVVAKRASGSKTKRERLGSCFSTMLFSRSTSTNGQKMMSLDSGLSTNQNLIVVG